MNLRLIEKINKIYIFAAILASTAFLSCYNRDIKTIERNLVMMDTFVTIKIHHDGSGRHAFDEALDAAIARMKEIESLTSGYDARSEIARINRTGGTRFIPVSPEIHNIVRMAIELSAHTDGAYDPTVGGLTLLWGFGRRDEMLVPDSSLISEHLANVDFRYIKLKEDSLFVLNKETRLDLTGIAKGYAVDEAIETLRQNGIEDAQVDAGGDLRTISSKFTAGKRNAYVRHPIDREKFYGRFRLDTGAVATSGDYERFFMVNGKRYHHILNPKTGYPGRLCRSVTIKGESTALCDGLATAVFVLGPEKGLELIENLPEYECLIIYEKEDELVHKMSPGLQEVFEIL